MNVILSIGAKACTMVVALVCGIVTTRLILTNAGVHEYALYTLLIGLPGLISFTDLGAGAVIINRIAVISDPKRDPVLVSQVTTVGRIMLGFAAVAMALNGLLFLTGSWRFILGGVAYLPHAELAAFLAVSVFCLGIPLGIWQRIFIGLGKNHLIILIQGLLSPLTLLLVWSMINVDLEAFRPFLALGSLVAALLVAAGGFAFATRSISPVVSTATRNVLRLRSNRGTRVMNMGWPMLAQLLATPLSTQTQRFILAQFVSATAIAQYGIAGQIFFALQALVSTAGLALWPTFMRARANGDVSHGPFGIAALFFGGCALFTIAIALAGPVIYGLISGGSVDVPLEITLAFGLMVALQAALYPLGMFMMDTAGVRFQVLPALLMASVTIGLSFILTPALGVIGPMLANATAVVSCQLVPFSVRIIRRWTELTAGSVEDESLHTVDAQSGSH